MLTTQNVSATENSKTDVYQNGKNETQQTQSLAKNKASVRDLGGGQRSLDSAL